MVRSGLGPCRLPCLPPSIRTCSSPRSSSSPCQKRRHVDQQGVLHDGPGEDHARPPPHSAEHPALHRDHASGRPRTARRRLEAVRAHPAGACAGSAASSRDGQLGRGGVRRAAQRRAHGALFGQLLRNDAVAGRAARSASGRRVPCQLHADMALRLMVDRLAGATSVRRRRIENRRAAPHRHRLRTALPATNRPSSQMRWSTRASGVPASSIRSSSGKWRFTYSGSPVPCSATKCRSIAVSPAADGRAAGMAAVEARHPGGCPPAGPRAWRDIGAGTTSPSCSTLP